MDIEDIQKEKGKLVLDYIANGLSESDSLTLVEWTEEDFENFKNSNPRYNQLVQRKKIEYKHKLMIPITKEIGKGDARLAQWMLERQFHNDFSNKKRPQEEASNPISIIIQQIQNGTSSSSLITPTRRINKIIAAAEEGNHIIAHTRDVEHVIDMSKKFTGNTPTPTDNNDDDVDLDADGYPILEQPPTNIKSDSVGTPTQSITTDLVN